jgi:nucleoside-diphosphate-sugar epimerase
MNCLVTGVNGFLGKFIFDELQISHLVFGLSRRCSNFNFYLDKSVPKFNVKFDLVVHAAGKAHFTPKTICDNQDFYQINVVGTQNLLKGLLRSGIPKYFIFISSVSVYGKDFGIGLDETTPLGAFDPYGISKIEAERIILEWCKQHHVVCTILRLPLIVGSNPPGNLRTMIRGIKKGYYFNVAGGIAKKSMVLAEDVAKSIERVASIGGIYNLTDGYHPSFSEISYHISIQLNKSKPLNMNLWLAKLAAYFGDYLGSKALINTNKLNKITSDLTFDDSKARKAFGWKPRGVLDFYRI